MMDPSFFNDKSSPKIQGIHLSISECVKIFYGIKLPALMGLARETKTKLFDLCLSFQKSQQSIKKFSVIFLALK